MLSAPHARADQDAYTVIQKFASVSSKTLNSAGCLLTGTADFDTYTEHLPLIRESWLNRDYSIDFYRQRRKQVFVYVVVKRFAELVTQGLYLSDKPETCSFAVNITYVDKLGKPATLPGAISWTFTREKADQINWEKLDPRNFGEVAPNYKISPAVVSWLSDEPSMAGESRSASPAPCEPLFPRANAVFIRATTHCTKNYMDSNAGYYALAMTRQCALNEEQLMSIGKSAMGQLDRIVKTQGKAAACRWVDGIEREVMRAAVPRQP